MFQGLGTGLTEGSILGGDREGGFFSKVRLRGGIYNKNVGLLHCVWLPKLAGKVCIQCDHSVTSTIDYLQKKIEVSPSAFSSKVIKVKVVKKKGLYLRLQSSVSCRKYHQVEPQHQVSANFEKTLHQSCPHKQYDNFVT